MSRKSEDQKDIESNGELRNIVSVHNYVDAIMTHYVCSVYKFPLFLLVYHKKFVLITCNVTCMLQPLTSSPSQPPLQKISHV